MLTLLRVALPALAVLNLLAGCVPVAALCGAAALLLETIDE